MTLRIVRLPGATSAELVASSRNALDCGLSHAASLRLAVPSISALILGAMQRFTELDAAHVDPHLQVMRRGSGGGEVVVGPGTVWMQLALSESSALLPCPPSRLLNRYVRPLLRALTKLGALAHYFDRDWVSASNGGIKGPVAQLAFAHDATTGRALVEAFIGVTTPFAVRARPSFLGQAPLTLRELGVAPDGDSDADRVIDALVRAYSNAYESGALATDGPQPLADSLESFDVDDDPRRDLAWVATREDAIGTVAAGCDATGRFRVGGELMASRDALAALEDEVMEASTRGTVDGARIDRALTKLGAPGVAMFGVRNLRSLRDVIDEALIAGNGY